MTRATAIRILFSLVSVVFVLAAGEAAVRVLAPADADGNRVFAGRRLEPHRPPIRRVEAAVRAYQEARETMFVYDADLGWAPRPGASNPEASHNSQGVRVEAPGREFPADRMPDAARLTLFGDSFVYGSEVGYADTWAHRLGQALAAADRPAEVINFGVPGYGTDQAFLRWQLAGRAFSPDIVVFGLQLENLNRNVNLIRPLYIPAIDLPFSKPRFIETDGRLEVINRPALPPDRLAGTLAGLESWNLREHEAFYAPDRFVPKPWQRSVLLALLVPAVRDVLSDVPRPDDLTPEKLDLAYRILSAFEADVTRYGARFVVVHLPRQGDLRAFRASGAVPHQEFLQRVASRFTYVETIEGLSRKADEISFEALFRPGGHYTPPGNEVVGDLVAAAVVEP